MFMPASRRFAGAHGGLTPTAREELLRLRFHSNSASPRGFGGALPSTSSQFASSIGGGSTFANFVRANGLSPLPPRPTTRYAPGPNSVVFPDSVSTTSLSNRPPTIVPPKQTSPSSSLMPMTPLPAPASTFTSPIAK